MVDEKALVEVILAVHLLCVILVEQSDVPGDIALIKNAMQALAGAQVAKVVTLDALFVIADALVGQRHVGRNLLGVFLSFIDFFVK